MSETPLVARSSRLTHACLDTMYQVSGIFCKGRLLQWYLVVFIVEVV